MNNRSIFQVAFVSLLLLVFLSGTVFSDRPTIRAGSTAISITPNPETHKVPLGGYGARKGKPATGVRDPVMARVLYLEQGDTKLALVSCDLVLIPQSLAEAVRLRLEAGGLGDVVLFIAATHSHAAPEAMTLNSRNTLNVPALGKFDPWLMNWTADIISLCIAQAIGSAQPARIALGTCQTEGLVRNRRDDSTTDPRLTVLKVTGENDRPIAAVVHFAAHPTILGPSMMDISAGWPGVLCRTLEKTIDAGIHAMFFNGAEGDISPVAGGSGSDVERMVAYGKKIAGEAVACLEGSKEMTSPILSATRTVVVLPERTVSPQFAAIAGAEYQLSEAGTKVLVERLIPQEATIYAVGIGSLILVGVPGEMTSSLGLKVRNALESNADVTAIVVGLVGDWIGYILPPEEYDEGGYEATVSFHGRTLGTVITDAAIATGKSLIEERN